MREIKLILKVGCSLWMTPVLVLTSYFLNFVNNALLKQKQLVHSEIWKQTFQIDLSLAEF